MNIKNIFNPIWIVILALLVLCIAQIPGAILNGLGIPDFITIIVAICLLAVYGLRHKDFDGFFNLKNFKYALTLFIPFLIYLILSMCVDMGKLSVSNLFNITLLTLALGAAVLEEVVFRGFLISNLMRILDNKYKIYIALILSAVIFGILHLMGYNGNNLGIIIVQVFSSMGLGFIFASIFLRTGNIWIPIIGHVLNNFIAVFGNEGINNSGVMVGAITWTNYVNVALSIVLIVIAIYYVRSSKHKEITELWNEKWSKD